MNDTDPIRKALADFDKLTEEIRRGADRIDDHGRAEVFRDIANNIDYNVKVLIQAIDQDRRVNQCDQSNQSNKYDLTDRPGHHGYSKISEIDNIISPLLIELTEGLNVDPTTVIGIRAVRATDPVSSSDGVLVSRGTPVRVFIDINDGKHLVNENYESFCEAVEDSRRLTAIVNEAKASIVQPTRTMNEEFYRIQADLVALSDRLVRADILPASYDSAKLVSISPERIQEIVDLCIAGTILDDLKEAEDKYRDSNHIRVANTMRQAGSEIRRLRVALERFIPKSDHCEHSFCEFDWCPECNAEYNRAAADPDNSVQGDDLNDHQGLKS